jgi:hypothetical protein
MKVLINACHGGFGLSDAAFEKLLDEIAGSGINFTIESHYLR